MERFRNAIRWFLGLFWSSGPKTLEDEIFNLLRRSPVLDVSQISVALLVVDLGAIEFALTNLMSQGIVESYYEKDTRCTVYKLATR
jgi:predicted transcriptional regulator